MFDSLKGKFKNIFKKSEAEEKEEPAVVEPKAKPEKEKPVKPVKEKAPKKVFDDDWEDDWDDEPDDLIPEDEWDGEDPEDEEDVPVPVKTPKPPKEQKVKEHKAPEPVPQPKAAPAPAPVKTPADDGNLSRKDRAKLAKQEKIAAKQEKKAAKEAAKDAVAEKKHEDGELIGDHGKKIKEKNLDSVLWELEVALMEADVALPVVKEIMNNIRDDLVGKKYARGHTLDEVVELSIKDSILNILKLNEFDFDAWFETKERPVVIMFVGINGTGKTTSIAKIANRLMKKNKSVVLAAADTFRAGAIEQLTIHSERLGCKIVKHSMDADPAAVAFDAIDHAKAKRKDAVLVDTAGRMQTNSNLMDEMKKIKKVAKPDLVMFVGDSLAGNDAVEQARAFDAAVGIDAIMLTKIDADSKGGAALSIAHTIGKPIAFVSNGQEYDQLIKFSAKWMMDRLFED
jgi:fused signal recognition particle receptor